MAQKDAFSSPAASSSSPLPETCRKKRHLCAIYVPSLAPPTFPMIVPSLSWQIFGFSVQPGAIIAKRTSPHHRGRQNGRTCRVHRVCGEASLAWQLHLWGGRGRRAVVCSEQCGGVRPELARHDLQEDGTCLEFFLMFVPSLSW
jgi:hypothetical protein